MRWARGETSCRPVTTTPRSTSGCGDNCRKRAPGKAKYGIAANPAKSIPNGSTFRRSMRKERTEHRTTWGSSRTSASCAATRKNSITWRITMRSPTRPTACCSTTGWNMRCNVRSANAEVGVIFIDLDHFKDINDSYGHSTGDKILCEVARRIAASLREGDTVARLGGDEFVVLLEQLTDGDAVEMAANRINASLIARCRSARWSSTSVPAWESASTPRRHDGPGTDPQRRYRDVPGQEPRAKQRPALRPCPDRLRPAAVELENALRRAVARRQLTVAFQPQFSLDQRTMTGMEALARWTDRNWVRCHRQSSSR